MRYVFFALLFMAFPAHATATKPDTQWQGTVTYVTDGDTLWVQPTNPLIHGSTPRKIRIEGIDAPESCQLYGHQSTLALKQLIARQSVTVTTRRLDDYGRDVAKITVNNMDVGAWMVSHGHAWSYHYRHSAGPYAKQEARARSAHRGLFASPSPAQPSDFRRAHGSCHTPRN
ncbi:MAG: thermonuclease family protein [Burkholderiaceae bacterium]|nr:thermonuclease family protein [Burkholderiaceae bacterium]